MTRDPRAAIAAFLESRDVDFGLAVSGGGDSMALLHLVAEHRGNHRPVVLTVNHNLRPDAAAEAAGVADVCVLLGLVHETLDWSGWDGQGNLQAAARDARYDLLAAYARANGLDSILLGHTADDVAETFLMRLARGSGLEGLAAMPAHFHRLGVDFDRPLIDVSRADLRAYLSEIGGHWIEDPSNDDTRFERVKIRQALPSLGQIGLTVDRLADTATRLRTAQAVLSQQVARLAAHVDFAQDGTVSLDRLAITGFLPEVQRQFWAKLLQWLGRLPYPPRADAQQAALARADAEGRAQIGGCEILVAGQGVTLLREARALASEKAATTAPWDGRWRLDGPHAAGLTVRMLGEDGLKSCPDWRDTGVSRMALIVSPAVFSGETLVAAPLAGLKNGWTTRIVADFTSAPTGH